MPTPITIFQAKQIVTMNPSNPKATHVAVREGKILGAGTLAELKGWGAYELDDTFKDHVLVPGFIEAHAHVLEGALAELPYTGYFDRKRIDGSTAKGIKSYAELIDFLKQLDQQLTPPDAPLIVQGFDPIYFPGERLAAKHLDQVSLTRPILVFHASGHLATVNTALMRASNITRATTVAGVGRDENGDPDGELQEMPAMALATAELHILMGIMGSEDGIRRYGAAARNAGLTTVTDMASMILMQPQDLATWQRVVNNPAFPARVASYNLAALAGVNADWTGVAAKIKDLQMHESSDKLRFPGVKFVIDGSIQGWTAVLNWPGYYTGEDHGLLLTVPEQFKDWMLPFHKAGIQVSVHCNGDKTADIMIDAVEDVLKEWAWLDHRHTVQHAQLLTSAQLRRMAKLGLCANFFTNHLWYWGDQHYEQTVGPERANRMEPCATAIREGVHFSLHTDANVTPLGHLHTMWCAVNRVTPSGRILGEEERISAYDALYATTVGAAYQMHMDSEIGSIEIGKLADFTVLEASPLDVKPIEIKDIGIWGTVVGGVKYPAPSA
ncbi:MAG: amidohydrolase [Anaerolineales bacterium]|nr:amidohydrolase [Anaerolineales bacterium]